jgi:hypothetical protein
MKITALMSGAIAVALAAGCSAPDLGRSSIHRNSSRTAGAGGTGGGGAAPETGSGGSIGPLDTNRDGGLGAFGVYPEPVVLADPQPPPISGGTLTIVAQGRRAAVADPDRDQLTIVDLEAMGIVATVALRRGDEPSRIVEDGAGRLHVVLRGAAVIATIDATAGVELERRAVCSHPRGIAYDAKTDVLHTACAGGELVTFPAGGGSPTRVLKLDRDLRDVVVDGNRLLVSRFRAADLLVIEATGEISARLRPLDPPPRIPSEPVAPTEDRRESAARLPEGLSPSVAQPTVPPPPRLPPRAPAVAWRTIAAPGGGAIMVFQLVQVGDVKVEPGGWGGPCRHIVDSAVSWVRADGIAWSIENVRAVLPVDVAASSDGARIAVASAATTALTLRFPPVEPYTAFQAPAFGERRSLGCGIGAGGPVLAFDDGPLPAGRVVALAFDASQELVVQTREPSMLLKGNRSVALPGASRKHTGHELFHLSTAGLVACASCHPEGQEDGQVWTFPGVGARRTQAISGGILGTEPFHWSGDLADFEKLVHETFNRRMSGPLLQSAHVDALATWIDKIPRPKGFAPADSAAAERGRAVFDDPTVGCATCHAGERTTNNATVDVQTGGPFQVPSLLGLGARAPYMHQGCAETLADRFGSCGGGNGHGNTSALAARDLADLIFYLDTL